MKLAIGGRTLDSGWELLTVGQLVTRFPRTSKVFEYRGIDYFCGGRKTLEEACLLRGVDALHLRREIAAVLISREDAPDSEWESRSLTSLIENIVNTHHALIRSERPRLTELARKVARVHSPRHYELNSLADAVDRLFHLLVPHLDEEEKGFFTLAKRWEASGMNVSLVASLAFELERLEHDHHEVRRLLESIRRLTSGFVPPSDGCDAYLTLFDGLESLEEDIHLHVHKENNILHARILSALGKGTKAKRKRPRDAFLGH